MILTPLHQNMRACTPAHLLREGIFAARPRCRLRSSFHEQLLQVTQHGQPRLDERGGLGSVLSSGLGAILQGRGGRDGGTGWSVLANQILGPSRKQRFLRVAEL